jgi:hypothetical protein
MTWLPAFTVIVVLSNLRLGTAEISTVSPAAAVVGLGAGALVGVAVAAAVGIAAIVGEAAFCTVGEAAGRVGLAAAAGRVDVVVAFVPPPPQATDTRAAVAMTRKVDAKSLRLDIGDLLFSA